jgi:20S proteasome alpha/beta subunit
MAACSSAAAGEAPTTGEHRMGTTIVGVCYDGGVILGADSRTSTGSVLRSLLVLDLSAPREILPPLCG